MSSWLTSLLKLYKYSNISIGVGVKMVQSQKPLGTILNKHIYGKYEMFEVSGQNFKFWPISGPKNQFCQKCQFEAYLMNAVLWIDNSFS